MESKIELRKKIKTLRKQIDIKYISKIIVAEIRNSDEYKNANNIMIFYPMKDEINLLELLNDGKNFYFPKVQGDNLLVCPDCGEFQKSSLKVFEPVSEAVDAEIIDLIIVPALAVDKNNFRLGYGGGYYDRFLSKYPQITTICPVCAKFVFEEIPHDILDIRVDRVICV